MSQQNVEVVRSFYRACNDGDWLRAGEFVHPDIEWVPYTSVGEGPIRGRANVMEFLRERGEVLVDRLVEIERVFDNEDTVVALVRVTGTRHGSGAPFDIRLGHLFVLRDGVVTRAKGFGDREEALEAAGLRG